MTPSTFITLTEAETNDHVEPNATCNGQPCISLRDQPWAEAERTITQAWEAGYHSATIDDAVMLTRGGAAFPNLSAMLAYCKVWWNEGEGTPLTETSVKVSPGHYEYDYASRLFDTAGSKKDAFDGEGMTMSDLGITRCNCYMLCHGGDEPVTVNGEVVEEQFRTPREAAKYAAKHNLSMKDMGEFASVEIFHVKYTIDG